MNLEEISFGIISHSGEAFANMREAITFARENDFTNAEEKMKLAERNMLDAHEVHTKLLMNEANGNETQYSILLSHAQDTMMNSMLFQTIAEEFILMYRKNENQ